MTYKVAHQSLIREARKEIRALQRPRHIRRDVFGNVIDLLCTIAGYLPDCWPSERTLAKKMDREQKSVHRWLCHAREWGLVTTTPRPLPHSWRPGQGYHLVCLSEGLKASIARGQFQRSLDLRSKSSSSKKTETGSPSGIPHRPAAPGRGEAMPERFDERAEFSGPAFGENPDAPLPSLIIPAGGDQAVYLARRFDSKWSRLIKRHPDLGEARGSDRGPATGYLRKVMLTQISAEYTEAYMDSFMEAVASGEIVMKEGQFAFERFVHWWGREPLEDPALARQEAEEVQAIRERLRALPDEPKPFLDQFGS